MSSQARAFTAPRFEANTGTSNEQVRAERDAFRAGVPDGRARAELKLPTETVQILCSFRVFVQWLIGLIIWEPAIPTQPSLR